MEFQDFQGRLDFGTHVIGDDMDLFTNDGKYICWSIESAIKEAEINGFEVIHSNIDRLLLDLDDEQALKTYEKVLPVVAVQLELKELDRWKSKSGTGTHVILQCKPLSFVKRVAIQAALGSDPIRECLAISMEIDGLIEPSVLFKPPKDYNYGTI